MNYLIPLLKKLFTSPYLALGFRLYLAWIFLYASLGKIADPAVFAENLAAYQIVPYWGLNLVAVIVPVVELACGFLLGIGIKTKAAASIAGGMLFAFTIFVLINILRGSQITCGCFDAVGDPIGWKKVIANTTWLLMAVHVFFFDRIHIFGLGNLFGKKRNNSGEIDFGL